MLGAVVVVAALLRGAARGVRSLAMQYAWLGLYVALHALVFVPALLRAAAVAPGAIRIAILSTLMGFIAAIALAFSVRRDFSALGALITGCLGLGLFTIVAAIAFDFGLGKGFAGSMVVLAGAAVLHDTSEVLHDSSEGGYVAASLSLFASIALMFWYVLSLCVARPRQPWEAPGAIQRRMVREKRAADQPERGRYRSAHSGGRRRRRR